MAENTVVYEGLFLFDANKFARNRDGLSRDVNELIESAGGQLELSRLWEERRLAYPINGQRKGVYWITYFRLPTDKLTELTRQCELKEGILRQLFIRLPDVLVEPILEHAKGSGETVESEAKEEKEEPKSVAAVEEVAAS